MLSPGHFFLYSVKKVQVYQQQGNRQIVNSVPPFRNCVAENKEKGSAEGEIYEVKAMLGGLMVCRPFRPFPLLGQGFGRGIWGD